MLPFPKKRSLRIAIILIIGFLAAMFELTALQRRLIYYPTHHTENNGLAPWRHDGKLIGFAREVTSPENIWLLLHGNADQASDRVYALPCFSTKDSVFILEYPGYGSRQGTPSMEAFNAAAKEAFSVLREWFPDRPVCVAGESIGSGPASILASSQQPPDKIVLITPFDTFARVAAGHFPFLPVRLILKDKWDNIRALKRYNGPVEIFAARADTVIPMSHAKALAASKPSAEFHEIKGGHNDWSAGGKVLIRNP